MNFKIVGEFLFSELILDLNIQFFIFYIFFYIYKYLYLQILNMIKKKSFCLPNIFMMNYFFATFDNTSHIKYYLLFFPTSKYYS